LSTLRPPEGANFDLCVVGGAGHVGLPLSILFAVKGLRVIIYDINAEAMETIASGRMPFLERGAEPLLRDALNNGRLFFTTEAADVARASNIVIVIGTPVDEFLNPSLKPVMRCMDTLLPHLTDDQLIILRSTIYPGLTDSIGKYLESKNKKTRLSFCPERTVQGFAVEELESLPQVVSGTTPEAEDAAAALFAKIAPTIVRLSPIEAELAKLFSNAYRYIQMAVTNQFYLIASSAGVDYVKVLDGMKQDYPRMADMQLAAFCKNQFSMGHAAMLVNESLPMFVVDSLAGKHRLEDLTVGLLGMAFKADSDDARSSLSYKVKKLLVFRAKDVLTTDPYITSDPALLPLDEVISRSDILILCTPHQVYRDLRFEDKIVVDIWNFWGGREAQRAAA